METETSQAKGMKGLGEEGLAILLVIPSGATVGVVGITKSGCPDKITDVCGELFRFE